MAPLLRRADAEEIDAVSMMDPEDALLLGVERSIPCYIAEAPKGPICMFGVVPDSGTHEVQMGQVWMVGTDRLPSYTREIVKQSKALLDELFEDYALLHNVADCRNRVHLRWIEWLGFTFGGVFHLGPFDLPFQQFFKAK